MLLFEKRTRLNTLKRLHSENRYNQKKHNYKSTFILRWNSALSNHYNMKSFELDMRKFDYHLNFFPWRIKEWHNVHRGDIVYMTREGEEPTGIVMHGIIMSEPYTDKDWCTEECTSRLIDIRIFQIMHPEKAVLPNSKYIERNWTTKEWKGLQYITLVDKNIAKKLNKLFKKYLKENKEQFEINRNNGIAITEFEID